MQELAVFFWAAVIDILSCQSVFPANVSILFLQNGSGKDNCSNLWRLVLSRFASRAPPDAQAPLVRGVFFFVRFFFVPDSWPFPINHMIWLSTVLITLSLACCTISLCAKLLSFSKSERPRVCGTFYYLGDGACRYFPSIEALVYTTYQCAAFEAKENLLTVWG